MPHPQLDVKPLEHDAKGWYRLAVHRYAIRVVFRLLRIENEQIIEYLDDEAVIEDAENYLDITQAAFRSNAYGEELRKRHKRSQQ